MNESVKDPATLKVAELKLLLSKHKLSVKGKKAELVERYSVIILYKITKPLYRVKQHHILIEVPRRQESSTRQRSSHDVTWKNLIDIPASLPNFTINEVMDYFIYRNDSDGLERQDWKNLNSAGFKLFKEGHIQNISVGLSGNTCYIKGKCLPEMKKDRVYELEMCIDTASSSVKRAECTCPAGRGPSGSCKHIAAFCYALEDFVRTRDKLDDNDEASCTSVLQQWNKPRKRRLDSKMVEDISFRNEKFNVESKRNPTDLFDPRPSALKKTTEADIEELKDSLQCLPGTCGFIHLLSKPEVTNNEQDILPPIPRNVKARINHQILQGSMPPSLECLQEFGKSFISGITLTDMQREMIEKKTRLQSNCVRWHEERFCRLTASNFGKIIKRKSEFENLAQELLSNKKLSDLPALKWGREHENDAYESYEQILAQRHPCFSLRKSGIFIGNPSYLGASPDGILVDESKHIVGIVEIKCPYSAAKLTIAEACEQLDRFYLSKHNDSFILDRNHVYFYQVQGSMGLSGARFCDFIVWTPQSFEVITINFEINIWESEMLPKLSCFYDKCMLPAILY